MVKVTLKQVAELANVDAGTASRVLNRKAEHAGIGGERARRVHQAAQQLGYRPNAFARSIRTGRFGQIGLVMSHWAARSVLPPRLLGGVQLALAERDLNLLVTALPDEKLTSEGYVPRLLRELTADGLLINYNAAIPARMIELIEAHHLPSIWLNTKRDHDAVYPDDWQASADVTRRVLALGHRRVAYIDLDTETGEGFHHYSAEDRWAAHRHVMLDAGLEARHIGRATPGGWFPYLKSLLTGADAPTAFVCYTAVNARTAMGAAYQAQVRVPEDVSIVCFADRVEYELGRAVATMLLPEEQMGRQAVGMLLEKIDEPHRKLPAKAIAFGFEQGRTLAPPGGRR
jgi:LacI family transcriptional regulator